VWTFLCLFKLITGIAEQDTMLSSIPKTFQVYLNFPCSHAFHIKIHNIITAILFYKSIRILFVFSFCHNTVRSYNYLIRYHNVNFFLNSTSCTTYRYYWQEQEDKKALTSGPLKLSHTSVSLLSSLQYTKHPCGISDEGIIEVEVNL